MNRSVNWLIVRRIVYWDKMSLDNLKFAEHWLRLLHSPYLGGAVDAIQRRNSQASRVMEFVTNSPTLAGESLQNAAIQPKNERYERNERRTFVSLTGSEKLVVLEEDSKIVAEYDYISVEDLNVKGMMQNRKLSKAVADVGIFELNRQLAYKAGWYGKDVTVISRWFPSTKTCSSCGQVHEMKLSDRVMNCDCGLNLDRDLNAAINIKWAGNVQRGEANQLIGEAKASQNKALLKREGKTVHDACMEQAA